VLLVATVIWMNWQSTDREVASAVRARISPESVPADRLPIRVTAKPDTNIRTARSEGVAANGILRSASQLQPQPAASTDSHSALKVAGGSSIAPTTPPEEVPAEPPSVVVTQPNSHANLGALVSRSADIPKYDPVVSEGVTPPVLVHRVLPAYPVGARLAGQAGSVVVNITIGEDGIPRDLKLVSGQGPLAQAGIDAVQQWRYRPALLNGKAVPMQQQITIVFKAQ
jgi:periplasmic protein TonB